MQKQSTQASLKIKQKRVISVRDMLRHKSLPKHHQYPKPRPFSPSWRERKLDQQIQSLLTSEVELEQPKEKQGSVARKFFGGVSLQQLTKMKAELQAEKAELAGEGKGANARAVTAKLVIDYRNRQKLGFASKELCEEGDVKTQKTWRTLTALGHRQSSDKIRYRTEVTEAGDTTPLIKQDPYQLHTLQKPEQPARNFASAQALTHAYQMQTNDTHGDLSHYPLNDDSDDQSLDQVARTRNIKCYQSQNVIAKRLDTSEEESLQTSKRDSLTLTFFNKLRQVNNIRVSSNQGKAYRASTAIKLKSHYMMSQSTNNQRATQISRMKQSNYNKSNLWSFIDDKHNPKNQSSYDNHENQTTNESVLRQRKPLRVSLYLKPRVQEVKVPFVDLDTMGFGHKADQQLSPKLQSYAALSFKNETKPTEPNRTSLKNFETSVKQKQLATQISFDRHDYNVLTYLQDESEDEEDQVDFQLEQHQMEAFGQYESTFYSGQIQQMVLDANLKLMTPQLDQLLANLKQANHWFDKGIKTTMEGNLSTAIQCYKQALILNKAHFIATFNLAVLYYKTFKLTSAKRWFLKTVDLEPKIEEAYRGASLACFKLGQYQQAEKLIDEGIKVKKQRRRDESLIATNATEEEMNKNNSIKLLASIFEFMYLQTLCLRRLGKYEEASTIYRKVRKFYLYSDRQRMINSAFGILLLPMCEDRRQLLNALEVMLKYIKAYGNQQDPISRPMTGSYWSHEEQSWLYKFDHEIVEELRRRSFFKRFSPDDLMPFLKKMTVKQHKFQNYIFPDQQVCIILSGAVEINYHEEFARVSKLIGRFQAGDIIGFKEGDGGVTNNVQAWTICISNVEAIWMPASDFVELWKKQQKYQRRIFYESLKLQTMFKCFNELTLHLLAFELLETRTFKFGQVVLTQHKRSMLNKPHYYFNKRQTNAILISILEQRKIIDVYGKDLSTSTFALMLKEVAKKVRNQMNKNKSRNVKPAYSEQVNTSAGTTERSTMANMLAISRGRNSSRIKKKHLMKEEPDSDKGVFIIDQGRCSIFNVSLGGGREGLFTEISRSSVFGESTQLEVAGLDYFGDIVAGSLISGPRARPDEPEVVCLYLSEKNFQRVPHHELKAAFEVQLAELEIYRNLAAKKFKASIADITIY